MTKEPIRVLLGGVEKRSGDSGLALAQAFLQAAEERAKGRSAEIHVERDRVLAEAWKEGFHRGLSALSGQIQSLQEARSRVFSRAKDELLSFIFTIAEEIVGEAIRAQPESICARIRAGLESLERRHELWLRVHPEDAQLVERICDEKNSGRRIKIVPDSRVARGCAELASEGGTWDLNPLDHLHRTRAQVESSGALETALKPAIPREKTA